MRSMGPDSTEIKICTALDKPGVFKLQNTSYVLPLLHPSMSFALLAVFCTFNFVPDKIVSKHIKAKG